MWAGTGWFFEVIMRKFTFHILMIFNEKEIHKIVRHKSIDAQLRFLVISLTLGRPLKLYIPTEFWQVQATKKQSVQFSKQ